MPDNLETRLLHALENGAKKVSVEWKTPMAENEPPKFVVFVQGENVKGPHGHSVGGRIEMAFNRALSEYSKNVGRAIHAPELDEEAESLL